MKGTYEILNYNVNTSKGNENRQMIVYYDNGGKEETRELYYPLYDLDHRGYVERNSIVSAQQDEE